MQLGVSGLPLMGGLEQMVLVLQSSDFFFNPNDSVEVIGDMISTKALSTTARTEPRINK